MKRSLRALLSGIVDYAGLFPPAELDMGTAVENYARYRRGANSWMLGCFVVPVSRFDEFLEAAREYLRATDDPWRLSAIIGDDVAGEMARVGALDPGDDDTGGGLRVNAVEVRAADPAGVDAIAAAVPAGVGAFVEVTLGDGLEGMVKALARPRAARAARFARLHAKIRTGGVTPGLIPPVEDVARFIRLCYATNVAFKATAGLHHPVRGTGALAYHSGAPRAVMHGFLNVFLAAAFCFNGLGAADAPRLLSLDTPREWSFDDDGVSWDDYRISTQEIEKIRRRFAVSFGSCSFDEPLDDLRGIGLID